MKVKILTDVKVCCDPPPYVGRWSRTLENKAKELERWVSDFHDFIRDHKSQDDINLYVEREYQEQCSFCGYEWEEDGFGQPVCCEEAQEEALKGINNL